MKKRRLVLSLEVETDALLADLRKTKTAILSKIKGVVPINIEPSRIIVDVIQAQANVIRGEK